MPAQKPVLKCSRKYNYHEITNFVVLLSVEQSPEWSLCNFSNTEFWFPRDYEFLLLKIKMQQSYFVTKILNLQTKSKVKHAPAKLLQGSSAI